MLGFSITDPTNSLEWMIFLAKKYSGMFLEGTWLTLYIAVAGTILGFLLGYIIGIIQDIRINEGDSVLKKGIFRILKAICRIYVEIFRDTPMIVQAMVLYYGIRQANVNITPLFAGVMVTVLNTGAYMAEIIRSGIQSVDKGQNEAAMSLGMTTTQTLMYVVFPQAIKNSFPSIGNQLIVNIKDSSMLNVITVTELYFQTTSVAGSNYRYIETFMVSAVLYLILTTLASFLLNYLEKRMDSESSMKDFCS